MPNYTLTEEDEAKVEQWLLDLQIKHNKKLSISYVDYLFSHTSGIGVSCTAIDRVTGENLDITDHSNW
jgi:hypothetical protein